MFEAILLKAQPLLVFFPDFRRVRAETQEKKEKEKTGGKRTKSIEKI